MRFSSIVILFAAACRDTAPECPTDTSATIDTAAETGQPTCQFTDGLLTGSFPLDNELKVLPTGVAPLALSNQLTLMTFQVQSGYEDCGPVAIAGLSVLVHFTDPAGTEWWREWLRDDDAQLYVLDADNGEFVMNGRLSGFSQDDGVISAHMTGALWANPGQTREYRIITDPQYLGSGDSVSATVQSGAKAISSSGSAWLVYPEIEGQTYTEP